MNMIKSIISKLKSVSEKKFTKSLIISKLLSLIPKKEFKTNKTMPNPNNSRKDAISIKKIKSMNLIF